MSLFGVKQVVKVGGMNCEHCAAHVKESLEKIEGVKSVTVSLQEKRAVVKSKDGIKEEDLKQAIEAVNKEYLGLEK